MDKIAHPQINLRRDTMQRRRLLLGIALLFLVTSGFVAIISSTPASAHITHSSVYIATTPDADTTLQMAQQEEANIQTILSIINILVVVYPILITIAALVLGYFGLRDLRTFRQQGQELLEDIQKQQKETLEDIQKQQEETLKDIKKLQGEAVEKQAEIGRTQQALVYLGLGDRYSNLNDTREAIKVYKKAGDLLPNHPQINHVLGRLYSAFGHYEEAIKSFEAAIAVEEQYPEAEMELGLAYRRRGEYRRGSDADTMRTQDYQKAIEHLQRAIELRPNYDYALSTLAGLYRRKGEYEKALEYYEAAYRTDPSSSYALGNVASLCWYQGRLDKARQYYMLTELASIDHSLTTHTEVYWDYYDLALAQLALGKTEDAKKSYAKAIHETPGASQFDSVLNVLYFLQKAQDPIQSLDEVIQTIEKEKSIRVSP
jgi:tetratricopeptide (TPR) repeat protein